jgi:hypothetical protein
MRRQSANPEHGCAGDRSTGRKAAGDEHRGSGGSTHTIVLRMNGSAVATSASDWLRVKTEWREAMEGASQEASTKFVDETVGRTSGKGAGTVVDVHVEDFHFVAPGARYTLGIMTGTPSFRRACPSGTCKADRHSANAVTTRPPRRGRAFLRRPPTSRRASLPPIL